MDRRFKGLAAVALATGLTAALVTPASAAANDTVAIDDLATPEMITAIERDLDLSTQEAIDRLTNDLDAMQVHESLSDELGDAFGGSWIDESGKLVVAVTDSAQAEQVSAAGAQPELVQRSEAALAEVVTTLDNTAAPDASEVHGWHADITSNDVVVQAAPGAEELALEWLAGTGVDISAVRVETSDNAPQLYYDVIGGLAYNTPSGGCSVGFAVQPRGYVTAGHCGTVGTRTTGHNGASQGTFQRSIFPGNDAAYVAVNANWRLQPLVSQYNGSHLVVNGSQVAPIGAATCRSGRTSGYQCGTIQAYNQTVNYAQGPVHGMTRTNACAAPGDSGGAFVASGINAQGVTSGGSGFCGSGGAPQTFFQPVNPMLNSWGLSLVTR